jgi:hypothetical protein
LLFVCCWKSERLNRVYDVFVVGLIFGSVGGHVRHGNKGFFCLFSDFSKRLLIAFSIPERFAARFGGFALDVAFAPNWHAFQALILLQTAR